jgi:hypothetical protein
MARATALACTVVFAVTLAACGRKATAADCQLILDRSVELQMRELDKSDPEATAKRQAVLRQELEGEMKDCVGRRITDPMMACVRSATTTTELERCVR